MQLTLYGSALLGGCSTNLNQNKISAFGPVFAGDCTNFGSTCVPDSTTPTDPFQARIDAGQLTAPAADCSHPTGSVSGGHWQPGTYARDPQTDPAFAAFPRPLPFDPGVYVFCNGLSGDVTANSSGGPIGGTF